MIKHFSKSKKADISIVILIFMTVFLCGTALFIFLVNGNQNLKKITPIPEINNFYAETDLIELFAYNVVKDVVNKNNAISEKDFVNSFRKEYYDAMLSSKDILTSEQFYNYGRVLERLKNESNYELTIKKQGDKRRLFFLLRGIEFSQEMNDLPDSSINSIKYVRDIKIEIAL